jgi:hypothetical protein
VRACASDELLNRSQSCLHTVHLRPILRGALSCRVGYQPAHSLLVLEPPPKPDPNHRKKCNPKDRFDQQRFLKGEDVDDTVIHSNLRTSTIRAEYNAVEMLSPNVRFPPISKPAVQRVQRSQRRHPG